MKQSILLSVLVLLMLVVPSHFSYSQNNEAKNIKMAETYWTEVWSKGNLQAVADFYHPNAKHGEDFTIEGFQKSVASLREAFPDFKVTINDIFAAGNRVVCEVTYTGSHTGRKMFKQEPLGKLVTVPGIDIFTFKDGKCINHQHVADHLDLVMQMGIQLTPTAPDKKDWGEDARVDNLDGIGVSDSSQHGDKLYYADHSDFGLEYKTVDLKNINEQLRHKYRLEFGWQWRTRGLKTITREKIKERLTITDETQLLSTMYLFNAGVQCCI